ncbi:MAG: sulfotransferase family protein [Planktothrix sp.]
MVSAIFIVGCPRSGTTLLQSLLAAHSEIASFPETKFFEYLVPEYEPRRMAFGITSRRVSPMLKKLFQEIGRPEVANNLPKLPLFMGQYTRKFFKLINEIIQESGKSIFLEKTPVHLHYINYIEKFLNTPKFLHIVRNGSDVTASLYEAAHKDLKTWGSEFRTVDGCINYWIQDIEVTRQNLHKPNHFLVRYEQLVEEPKTVLEKVCQFIGVEFTENMLEDYRQVSQQLIRDRETWKATVSGDIQNANSQKFYKVFDAAQQQYILDRLSTVNLDELSPLSTPGDR